MVFEVGLVAATPAAIFVSSEPPVATCAAAGLVATLAAVRPLQTSEAPAAAGRAPLSFGEGMEFK